jgi:YVTN family beta-propeller protein
VFSSDGAYAYVSHNEDARITVIDTTANPPRITGTLFPDNPALGLALSPDGTRLYAAQVAVNSIQAIDASTSFSLGTISVGNSPDALIIVRR